MGVSYETANIVGDLPCISTIFSVGGEEKEFVLSNSTIPPFFPVNHYISPLCVSLFLVHGHVTVNTVLYDVVFSVTSS